MAYTVTIIDTGETYSCQETQHLLAGMVQLGKKSIPVGCRSGGCGVCKVKIINGDYKTKKMSREHITEQEEIEDCVLACRAFPESDIALEVIGKLNKAVSSKDINS